MIKQVSIENCMIAVELAFVLWLDHKIDDLEKDFRIARKLLK